MINKESLEIGWINQVSSTNNKADKILVEKVIRAFLLLEGLVKQNMEFVFKGGTSIMLLSDSPRRLSIDIDIIMPDKPDNIDEIFNNLSDEQGFTKVSLQERKTESNIQKEHYKFHYKPQYSTSVNEDNILLDILIEEINYQNIQELPIKSVFLLTDNNPVKVSVPSSEDLLGDKLTAFAPNTTGIPYYKEEKSMSMEIIKQLYDIGNLFDAAKDFNTVKRTFLQFAGTELKYRDKANLSHIEVLEDIYETSFSIISRGKLGDRNFNELQDGIQRISQFIFSESFYLEKAITFAAKAAYTAILIMHNAEHIERYDDPLLMMDWKIEEPQWPRINRLKKTNPEAFFYSYKIYEFKKRSK